MSRTTVESLFIVAMIAVILAAAVLVLLSGRRARARVAGQLPMRRRPLPWWARALATVVAGVMLFGLFSAIRSLEGPPPTPPQVVAPSITFPGGGEPARAGEPPAAAEPSVDRRGLTALFAAAGSILLFLAIVVGWRHAGTASSSPPAFHRRMQKIVADTIEDLRLERDPRRAIVAAYARMEHDLASHGVPRRPAEAPMEYLARILGLLEVSAPSADRLTDLFERAKFSSRPVDSADKDRAIDALVSVASELGGPR